MSATANFAATPRASSVAFNTANTDTTGTGGGSFPSAFTAGSAGSRVDSLKIKGIVAEGVTQAADSVRIWLLIGATKYFFAETLIAAGSGNVSATVSNIEVVVPLGFSLPASAQILVSTHTGGTTATYHATVFGADY